jgi:6-phosphofructokinase 1
MIGIKNEEVVYVPFSNAIKMEKPIAKELLEVLDTLSL